MLQLNLKNISTLFIGLILLSISSNGQSNYINNQFWLQMPLFNPAASGVFNDLEIASGMQFQNKESLPAYLYGDLYNPVIYLRGDFFAKKINSGFGINYFNDNVNQLFLGNSATEYYMNQRVSLNYNYQFRLSKKNTLAVGINLDLENVSWFRNWLTFDPDPDLPPKTGNSSGYGLGAGLFYKSNYWYTGFSIVPLWRITTQEYFNYNIDKQYNLNGGVEFKLGKNLLMNTDLIVTVDDGNINGSLAARSTFKNIGYLGFGLSGNGLESWQAMIGVRIAKKYLLHYAYGQTFNNLISSTAMHNIAFQFSLGTNRSN